MNTQVIQDLFYKKIDRRIEEVIKVDQTDEDIICGEIAEYEVTTPISSHFTRVFETYRDTMSHPNEGIAIWVSGFFGSGKSSFAKMLGLTIANQMIKGEPASSRFLQKAGDTKLAVVLKAITEKIPTHAVVFDVSTDRGIRSGNQTLTEIMYGLFLQSLGYAKDLDLAELEIALEEQGALSRFEAEYQRIYAKDWNVEKGKIAFALSEASRVMHNLDSDTYPMADSWGKVAKNKADITPGKLAERGMELMKRRRPGQNLLFVIDEVGQFVARDVQKMLDLQAVVQSMGVKGRGKLWVVVTSQEKLGEMVSGIDDKKIEITRLMDRFPQQVHLEPSDISEVTSRRVLTKKAPARELLGKLFDENKGRLTENTRLTADIRLPELSRESFIDLYPLLPYQIDLIIQVVSGLRTQGGASAHVGGANRTIIKLAQQLLINPAVNLAAENVGALVRLDQVYDLVEGNIGSEVRAKITSISQRVKHPLAQPVAKIICLLQFVKSVHRTAENIAATLYPSVAADSKLPEVRAALQELEDALQVRCGDDGYRILTPAEDDWEKNRIKVNPAPGDEKRIHGDIIKGFWQPQPQHALLDAKVFRAGLSVHGRPVEPGDIVFSFYTAVEGEKYQQLAAELRTRSQQERNQVFWAVPITDAIDRETQEIFRSGFILGKKEREAKTAVETTLISEEKIRKRNHEIELARLLKIACLSGDVYFRGNDRSAGERAVEVGKSVALILGIVLPEVFDRFKEMAVKPTDVKKGLEALFTAENLQGLPAVFGQLQLLSSEQGKTVFQTDAGPLAEMLKRIASCADYGDTANGRFLSEELYKEPFGWDFESVRLLALCLLRAGKIEATSRGQLIDLATSPEAREAFSNNNLFKQTAFRPKKGVEFSELVKAAAAFRESFGIELKELTTNVIAAALRMEMDRHASTIDGAIRLLSVNRLKGAEVLEEAQNQMASIRRGSDENAISTFNASHRSIQAAIKRGSEVAKTLTETGLRDIRRAQRTLKQEWPFLNSEPDLPEEFAVQAEQLADLLARDTFFRDLASIDQFTARLEQEYSRRYQQAATARKEAYEAAYAELIITPGWEQLPPETQQKIASPLRMPISPEADRVPIPQIRADIDACPNRLRTAVSQVLIYIEGERLVTVSFASYFSGGIETEEQLEAALTGIRNECARFIGAGKKVVVQ